LIRSTRSSESVDHMCCVDGATALAARVRACALSVAAGAGYAERDWKGGRP